MAIFRFIHIADPHLGAGVIPRAQGHDPRVLEALLTFLEQDPEGYRPRAIIVTGDVTARGNDSDLQMYMTLCHVGFAPDATGNVFPPLHRETREIVDLPGNHDYWKGWLLNPALNRRIRGQYFPDERTKTWKSKRHLVAVHPLCSTAGARWTEQAVAVGAFDPDDLKRISQAIADLNAEATNDRLEPFHLIATHHSPSYGSPSAHGITLSALQDLAQVVAAGPVRGILTGHAHTRDIIPATSQPCAEVRCATTTQGSLARNPDPREFLVHELNDENPGPLVWSVTAWAWSGTAFVVDPAGPQLVSY